MASDQGAAACSYGSVREYRKGNWTVEETMVLIEAKKMDEERRTKKRTSSTMSPTRPDRTASGSSSATSKELVIGRTRRPNKPEGELRWKWVEEYCWRKGCLRSQNQCNDKWDNLMREFKKVRDYETMLSRYYSLGSAASTDQKGGVIDDDDEIDDHHDESSSRMAPSSSYWKIDKNERKQRNLPSNMLPLIYEALMEVVERKGGLIMSLASTNTTTVAAANYSGVVLTTIACNAEVQPSLPPPPPPLLLTQYPLPSSAPLLPVVLPLPPPPQQQQLPAPRPPAAAAQEPHGLPHDRQPFPAVDSDTSEHSDSPAKRRRRGGEGTSGTAASGSSLNEVLLGSTISKSASTIVDAIQASEERAERRHRDVMSLQERRLHNEESNTEITRQGISSLVDAINKLADSILVLASNKSQTTPKGPH